MYSYILFSARNPGVCVCVCVWRLQAVTPVERARRAEAAVPMACWAHGVLGPTAAQVYANDSAISALRPARMSTDIDF